MDTDVDVNGEWPDLVGRTCDDLVLEEHWYGGALTEPANVIWLRVEGAWHRLYFDCGIVFWRRAKEDPEPYDTPEHRGAIRLVRLPFSGDVIESVTARAIEGGSEVAIEFGSGRAATFRDVDDQSSYVVA